MLSGAVIARTTDISQLTRDTFVEGEKKNRYSVHWEWKRIKIDNTCGEFLVPVYNSKVYNGVHKILLKIFGIS